MIKVDCAVCGMPLDPFDLKPHKCLSKEKLMKPHKHAELIKAWADGAEIEAKIVDDVWSNCPAPAWYEDMEYRIKPDPKPDYITFLTYKTGWSEVPYSCYVRDSIRALKLTHDGETGELKSAEVLK